MILNKNALLAAIVFCASASSFALHHDKIKAAQVAPTLRITQQNALESARAAVNTIGIIGRFMFESLFSVVVNPYSSSENPELILLFPPQVRNCFSNGTLTLDSDGEGTNLAPGSSVTAEFEHCDDGFGVAISGTINITVQENITNNYGPPYSYTFVVSWIDYTEVEYGYTRSLNGLATLKESTLDDIVFDGHISGSTLHYSESDDFKLTLIDFTVTKSIDTENYMYSYHSRGVLVGGELGGSIRYATAEPLLGYSEAPPFSGTMNVTGFRSKAIVKAINSFDVSIELDTDADGSIDFYMPVGWDQF